MNSTGSKRLLLFFLIPVFLFSMFSCTGNDAAGKPHDKSEKALIKSNGTAVYHTAIIGAGLAGLSAAYELRDKNIIVIEKESYPGGRVLTKTFKLPSVEEIPYELGAVFQYEDKVLPEGLLPEKKVAGYGQYGILTKGKITWDNSIRAAFRKIQGRTVFKQNRNRQLSSLSKEEYTLLNGLFRLIHPLNINKYARRYINTAFATFSTTHFVSGNKYVVDHYVRALDSKIHLNTTALSVTQKKEGVAIRIREGKTVKTIMAHNVIIATNAVVAKKLLGGKTGTVADNVSYGRFGVTAFLFEAKDALQQDFDYIITPFEKARVVIQYPTQDKSKKVFLVYFADDDFPEQKNPDKSFFKETALDLMRTASVISRKARPITTDTYLWKAGGTLLTDELIKQPRKFISVSDNILLAGDYAVYAPEKYSLGMPYGMIPALFSGREAGRSLRKTEPAVTEKKDNESCVQLAGFTLLSMPTERSMETIRKLRPEIFGFVHQKKMLEWLNNVDFTKVFGYKAERYFGSRSYVNLMKLTDDEIGNIDIIGYCPRKESLATKTIQEQLHSLARKFPTKKVLFGPCVSIYARTKPDKVTYLGPEIVPQDYQTFLDGKYDDIIKNSLKTKKDQILFISLYAESLLEPNIHKQLVKKAIELNLSPGYSVLESPETLSFLENTFCTY